MHNPANGWEAPTSAQGGPGGKRHIPWAKWGVGGSKSGWELPTQETTSTNGIEYTVSIRRSHRPHCLVKASERGSLLRL